MNGLLHKLRAWHFERRTLLICAGSNPGRVPLVPTTRALAQKVKVNGKKLSLAQGANDGKSWSFEIIATDETAARDIAAALKTKSIYSIHPEGPVRTITIRREDWGPDPGWIGGDLSAAGVDKAQYEPCCNLAFVRKDLQNEWDQAEANRRQNKPEVGNGGNVSGEERPS